LLGGSLASGCDVNGDGFDDLIIGSTYNAFVYYGGTNISTAFAFHLQPITYGGQIVSLGDLNNDKYCDVIIGGNHKSHIYFASAQPDTLFDLSINLTGAITTGYFNRDQYSDVLIGDEGSFGGLGAVYVYLGGDPMDIRFDWGGRGTGGGNLGTEVANAGDVNGDGVEDILVSEPNYFFGKMKGRVFVIAGDTSTVTAVASETEHIVKNFILYPNYPNPFNKNTTINYQIPDGIWPVTLKIFNPLGEEVKTIVEKKQRGGNYQVIWNATDHFGKEVSSGIYLLVLHVGDFQRVRKVLLIR